MRQILTKPVKRRSEEELNEALLPILKLFKFFKERDDIKEDDFTEIGQCLTYETFKRGSTVFEWGKLESFMITSHNIGSFGDKFYIILQGTVTV